jgi:hypothetical protein
MAAADVHRTDFREWEDYDAAADVREELLERGAYDDPDECGTCGAETWLVGGRLIARHLVGCPAARAHLRVVS